MQRCIGKPLHGMVSDPSIGRGLLKALLHLLLAHLPKRITPGTKFRVTLLQVFPASPHVFMHATTQITVLFPFSHSIELRALFTTEVFQNRFLFLLKHLATALHLLALFLRHALHLLQPKAHFTLFFRTQLIPPLLRARLFSHRFLIGRCSLSG